MDVIINVVVGGVIGWVASMIMKTNAQMGKIANVLVGIIGTNLGFWLAGMIGMGASGIMRYVIAVVGAVLLIWILKLVGIFK